VKFEKILAIPRIWKPVWGRFWRYSFNEACEARSISCCSSGAI